jgi:hypothetical protein
MMINYVRSDQQENKSSVLPHFLFYRNVSLSLIVHICILAIYSRFIGCLPLEKSHFLSMVKLILGSLLLTIIEKVRKVCRDRKLFSRITSIPLL